MFENQFCVYTDDKNGRLFVATTIDEMIDKFK